MMQLRVPCVARVCAAAAAGRSRAAAFATRAAAPSAAALPADGAAAVDAQGVQARRRALRACCSALAASCAATP
jgi:hypothetical protein